MSDFEIDLEKSLKIFKNQIFSTLKIDDLKVYFQPIFSINLNTVIGVEALLRGVKDGKLISPLILFESAKQEDLNIELDIVARYIAFKTYKKFLENFNEPFEPPYLFFNFDASIFDKKGCPTWFIYRLANKFGLEPSQIVIEVTETKVENLKVLKDFIKVYKEQGFLIAIDDVGQEYSNINRIIELKPDFLKIDRNIIQGIAVDNYRYLLTKKLVDLSKSLGIFAMAEGIETKEDLIKGLEIGLDFCQGYLFSPPIPIEEFNFSKYKNFLSQISQNRYIKNLITTKKYIYRVCENITKDLISKLINQEINEDLLKEFVKKYENIIHSIFIKNSTNKLVTPIIFNPQLVLSCEKKKLCNFFKKGCTFPLFEETINLFTCDSCQSILSSYVHFITKKNVWTIFKKFFHEKSKQDYIVCIEFFSCIEIIAENFFIKNSNKEINYETL